MIQDKGLDHVACQRYIASLLNHRISCDVSRYWLPLPFQDMTLACWAEMDHVEFILLISAHTLLSIPC